MGWKAKFISKVGRETLIKTVAQVIPTYSMGIFKILKALCDTINSTLAKYWWGQTKNEKKIHWINWKKLCNPKEMGGMGFRDIHALNLALLAKQTWWLIHQNHSLFFRVYKAQYFPNCSFMEAELGNNPSYVWRSLLAARDILKERALSWGIIHPMYGEVYWLQGIYSRKEHSGRWGMVNPLECLPTGGCPISQFSLVSNDIT